MALSHSYVLAAFYPYARTGLRGFVRTVGPIDDSLLHIVVRLMLIRGQSLILLLTYRWITATMILFTYHGHLTLTIHEYISMIFEGLYIRET